MSWFEKLMIRLAKGQYGDFRDWDEIRSWASRVAQELGAAPQAGSSPAR